jgi:hypothetical protein
VRIGQRKFMSGSFRRHDPKPSAFSDTPESMSFAARLGKNPSGCHRTSDTSIPA